MDSSMQTMMDVASSQVTATPQALGNIARASGGNIDKTAKDFESMFMSQMLQPMFESISVDPVFGGGHGEEVMRSLLVQEYGKLIANKSSMGITQAVKNELIRKRGLSPAQTAILQGG